MLPLINSLNPWIFGIALNAILLAVVWILPKKLLTTSGIIHAWLLGVIIWGTLGWQGYIVVAFYFLVGSYATRIGMAKKEAQGIAEKRSGARGPENVWGSALTAMLCALGVGIIDTGMFSEFETGFVRSLLLLGYVASFCTKLSDTCASEVGKAYGKNTFLITTLQPVSPGTEGAVSLEGTVAGVVASVVQALIGWGVGLIGVVGILWCVLAAFIATNIESVIGATLQSRFSWLTNELVNILNTLIGSLVAIIFAFFWLSINTRS